MKTPLKVASLVIWLGLCASCGEASKKNNSNKEDAATAVGKTGIETSSSGDYSALLTNFSCDISASEIAGAANIPSSDIKKTNAKEQSEKLLGSDFPFGKKEDKSGNTNTDCWFELKGFGTDNLGNDMILSFQSAEMDRASVKKEIKGYLERKKDGLEKITQMFIVTADTKDSYITTQRRYGRVIIYNEHHDGAFVISYGVNNANNDRTKEQQEILGQKMVRLANQLLKKYRK